MSRLSNAILYRLKKLRVRARRFAAGRLRTKPREYDRTAAPIFLVGCHRSGTSLVRRILNSHSHVAVPAETEFLEHFGAAFDTDFSEAGFEAISLSSSEAARTLEDLISSWFEGYARANGKSRWADKSPNNTWQLQGIDRLFRQRPLYVCITRDGRDVAHSISGANPPWTRLDPWYRRYESKQVAASHYWVDMNQRMLAFMRKHPERCFHLKYETLVSDPETTVQQLCAFLNLAYEPTMLDFNRFKHSGGLEDSHIKTTTSIEANIGKHRSLPADVQRAMTEVVAPTMQKLGYNLP